MHSFPAYITIMDREEIFQWIQKKEFSNIITFLKTGQNIVNDDIILQNALGHFFKELIDGNDVAEKDFIFGQLFILHTQKPPFFTFSEAQFENIVVHLTTVAKKPEEANFYASKLPSNPICAKIIASFIENRPKEIAHEQSTMIKVKEILSDQENTTKSIFNSKQEKLFFVALRNCFPSYFVYPNITLSTIVHSSLIGEILNASEKRFFYNTTIDFVVIDQFDDFKPVFAVELDSEWHRLNNQNHKDEIKNKILKASGLPFYRIEHFSKYKSLEEFEQVIIQTINTSRKKQ